MAAVIRPESASFDSRQHISCMAVIAPVTPIAQDTSRGSRASAASGSSHAMYQGSTELAVTSRATVAQAAPSIQSSCPRHTRRTSQAQQTTKTAVRR